MVMLTYFYVLSNIWLLFTWRQFFFPFLTECASSKHTRTRSEENCPSPGRRFLLPLPTWIPGGQSPFSRSPPPPTHVKESPPLYTVPLSVCVLALCSSPRFSRSVLLWSSPCAPNPPFLSDFGFFFLWLFFFCVFFFFFFFSFFFILFQLAIPSPCVPECPLSSGTKRRSPSTAILVVRTQ